jgi:hypothetical protein
LEKEKVESFKICNAGGKISLSAFEIENNLGKKQLYIQ